MMGDVAKGIKAFKKGMSEDEAAAAGTTTTTTTTTDGEPVRTSSIRRGQPASATPRRRPQDR
jgi:sec-independent protein translocase protein TatA